MTTDTALALLAEDRDLLAGILDTYAAVLSPKMCAEIDAKLQRITALLDSGIKDAGDDLVEPERIKYIRVEVECGNLRVYKDFIDYIDTLLSAYKRVKMEKDALREALAKLEKQ